MPITFDDLRRSPLPATMRHQAIGLTTSLESREHYLESVVDDAKKQLQVIGHKMDVNERVIRAGSVAEDEFLDGDLAFLNEDDRHQRKRLEIAERQLKTVRLQMVDRAAARQAAE